MAPRLGAILKARQEVIKSSKPQMVKSISIELKVILLMWIEVVVIDSQKSKAKGLFRFGDRRLGYW
jgi:hypothetical protein